MLEVGKDSKGLLWVLGRRRVIGHDEGKAQPNPKRNERRHERLSTVVCESLPLSGNGPGADVSNSIRSPTGVNSSSPIIRVPFHDKSGAGRCSNDTPELLKVIFLELSRGAGENASRFGTRGVIIPKLL